MNRLSRAPEADPLYARPAAERPSYATGMLLDAQDFADEQTYHRGRLARALASLTGGGTLAGLRVSHSPATGGAAPAAGRDPRRARAGRRSSGTAHRGAAAGVPAAAGVVRRRDRGRRRRSPAPRRVCEPRSLSLAARDRGSGQQRPAASAGARRGRRRVRALRRLCTRPDAELRQRTVRRAQRSRDLTGSRRLRAAARRARGSGRRHSTGCPHRARISPASPTPRPRRARLQDAILDSYPASGRAGSPGELDPLPEHPHGDRPRRRSSSRAWSFPWAPANPPARTGAAVRRRRLAARRFVPSALLLGRWAGLENGERRTGERENRERRSRFSRSLRR